MLVTKRLNGTPIVLVLPDGREIRVRVVTAGVGSSRIGIEAPRDVVIVPEQRYTAATARPATEGGTGHGPG